MRQDFGPRAKIDFRPNTEQHSNNQWNRNGKSINDPCSTFFWNHYHANPARKPSTFDPVRISLYVHDGTLRCRQVPPILPIADSPGEGGKSQKFTETLAAIPELCPTDQVDLEIFHLMERTALRSPRPSFFKLFRGNFDRRRGFSKQFRLNLTHFAQKVASRTSSNYRRMIQDRCFRRNSRFLICFATQGTLACV